MRWVLAAPEPIADAVARHGLRMRLRLVASLAAVAALAAGCSGASDVETEAAAPTATPSPTPSPAQTENAGPRDGPEPASTRSPGAHVLFDWASFQDEATGISAALPEDAVAIANPIERGDGETTTSRGYVHEHAAGVIGYEVIDDFATVDDVTKLAELLAASVGGTVVASEPAAAGQASGIDGEIAYGEDHLMLFRIVVLNGAGDVWNGFVGGPAADRTRLESEFGRLTVSVNLQPAFDWVAVTDEPSGIVVSLPGLPYPPTEQRLNLADGVDTRMRRHVHADSGAGFAVVDVDTGSYDLEHVAAVLAYHLNGVVESTEQVDARGAEAVDAVIVRNAWATVYRIIELDGHLLLLYAGNRTENVDRAHELVGWLADTVVLP